MTQLQQHIRTWKLRVDFFICSDCDRETLCVQLPITDPNYGIDERYFCFKCAEGVLADD